MHKPTLDQVIPQIPSQALFEVSSTTVDSHYSSFFMDNPLKKDILRELPRFSDSELKLEMNSGDSRIMTSSIKNEHNKSSKKTYSVTTDDARLKFM
jgi:hypothetical protein